jgi:hypothetical protein
VWTALATSIRLGRVLDHGVTVVLMRNGATVTELATIVRQDGADLESERGMEGKPGS